MMKPLEIKNQLKTIIEEECLLKSDFKLSAGGSSSFYFDIKKASLNGKFLSLFSQYVLEHLLPENKLNPFYVGGMTLGADFLTAALVLKSYEMDKSIKLGSIVRKEPKKHGTKSLIENEITPDSHDKTILVVEDVITSGKSIAQATQEFINAGYQVVGLLTVIDRESGGKENLTSEFKLPLFSLFNSSDFKI